MQDELLARVVADGEDAIRRAHREPPRRAHAPPHLDAVGDEPLRGARPERAGDERDRREIDVAEDDEVGPEPRDALERDRGEERAGAGEPARPWQRRVEVAIVEVPLFVEEQQRLAGAAALAGDDVERLDRAGDCTSRGRPRARRRRAAAAGCGSFPIVSRLPVSLLASRHDSPRSFARPGRAASQPPSREGAEHSPITAVKSSPGGTTPGAAEADSIGSPAPRPDARAPWRCLDERREAH